MAKPKTAERSSGTEVGSKSITASPDETTISPRRHGYLKKRPELHVEHDRGQEGARGDRQRREELPLRRVAGEPPALAARVDEQDALRAEEGARVAAPRLEQPVQGPQRAAAGADPPRRRVGDHLEGQLPRVEPLLAAALEERPEGRRPAAPRRP